jgi:hypothetical protein
MPRLQVEAYRELAVDAVRAFIYARGGAVVWPEVEAQLSTGSALREILPGAPAHRLDPHHLTRARQTLVITGEIVEQAEVLNKRRVAAWVTTDVTVGVNATAVTRVASHKRKLYRTFLGWASSQTCGDVGERVVAATLHSLAGKYIWLDPAGRGNVRALDGENVPGGPLDHAGHFAVDPSDPTKGFVPFAVEDKNVRSTLYPWAPEVWDLLGKVGAFPDRVPILVTRGIHSWTFDLFATIGAVARPTQNQWFSPTIDRTRFADVTAQLGLHDAVQLENPDAPNRAVENFFTQTLHKPAAASDDTRGLMVRQAERWTRSAEVCARFIDLRRSSDDHMARYAQFLEELEQAGLDTDHLYNPERHEG